MMGQTAAKDTPEQRLHDRLARQAKVKLEDAREAALKRAPGTVIRHELEREKGKLIFTFDIRDAQGSISEVHVSGITGQVTGVLSESAAREAAERKKKLISPCFSQQTPAGMAASETQ